MFILYYAQTKILVALVIQVEKHTCRWSNSCWNIRAGRSDKLTENLVPLISRASIFTDSGR